MTLIAPFESIGENCEFGFVQRALGHDVSSLLRWTFLDSTAATLSGISTSFADVFQFDNLEPAAEGTMVRDRIHGIAFHSAMRAERNGSDWAFVAPESERRTIYAEEAKKFLYLREKFESSISGADRIYVAKRGTGLTSAEAEALSEAIGARGGNVLLYVTEASEGDHPGTARLINNRLAHGIVERFAPHTQTDDILLESWEAVLSAARVCFCV
jgi:hypothetical protein